MSTPNPDNLIGLNYSAPFPPPPTPIIDFHNHAGDAPASKPMVEAGRHYGVTQFVTMTQLENIQPLNEAFPNIFRYIAVPGWKRDMPVPDDTFFNDWRRRLEQFAAAGSRIMKIH